MRCVVNENFKVFHGHSPVQLEAGQIVSGSLAELLLTSARRKVTALNDEALPATQPATPVPVHREPCVDGSVCGGPHCPPEAPDGELDIEASVKEVLDWVGEDPERAAEALRQEQEQGKPRSTLVKQLAKLAGTEA
ncbi:hypothetical protein [Streptomyces antibioticus]|uniref:hypothetical protein n=1 Tax=Streptomyces antibioticus TaxID=1890 RepID=UPI003701316A